MHSTLALVSSDSGLRQISGRHHREGNSYIERFHRRVKEEEFWTAAYRSMAQSAW